MSQIKTQLLVEDPSVVLIGEDSVFRNLVAKMLENQNLKLIIINPGDITKSKYNSNFFDKVYKVVWLYENNLSEHKEYLKLLDFLKEINSPITILTSLIINLKFFNSDLLKDWKKKSEEQTQFIIDCNYYLPGANFIFGQDIIISNDKNTTLEFFTQKINRGIIIDSGINLSFVNVNNFIESVKKHLFKPGKQNSILIKGKPLSQESVIDLLKKLYESYYKKNIEIIYDSVELFSITPFLVVEELIEFDVRNVATKIVKSLLPPKKDVNEPNIQKPIKKIIDKKVESNPIANEIITHINTQDRRDETKKTSDETTNKSDKTVDISEEIQRIFKVSRADNKIDRIKKIAKSDKKNYKKSRRRRIFFAGGIGTIGAAVGVIVLGLTLMISRSFLKKELSKAVSGETSDNLEKITKFVDLQINSYSSIIESNFFIDTALIVNISEDIQLMPQLLLEVDEASKNLFLQIMIGNTGETSSLAQILSDRAQIAYEKLSYIQASLEQVDFNLNSDDKEKIIDNYKSKLKKIRSEMITQQQLQPILPSLTGEKTAKTYAVIFQNNQELRPTGGFIQSVAILNFDKGSLGSYKVDSVYSIDKKLPGEISPPDDLKKYLGEKKWYLRDSNWSPDFPTTSRQIAWFLNKSLGVDVDGVVAINLITLREVLKVIGPIELPEYNEVITYKNIFERMEFHSEVVLVDSSSSMDYSTVVFEKIISKIINTDGEKIIPLLSSLENSLNDGQLLISVSDDNNETVFNELSWSGDLIKPQCPARLNSVDCIVNVFAQVEANVGINKANYYLEREIRHSVEIDRKKAVHKRSILFKNNAKSSSWPKGEYNSYQRFYINENAALNEIIVNGVALSNDQISQKKTKGFKELGIRVNVPIKSQVAVEINYSVPHSFENGFSYVFFNRNQPGTEEGLSEVIFNHSSDITPVLISPSAEVYNQTIKFNVEKNSSLFSAEFE